MKDCDKQKNTCPIKYTINVIGGKWKTMILYQIYINETRRYGELKRSLDGITHKMLSQQLKELERDDLVHREEYHQIPPKVEYSLTEKGKTVLPILKIMDDWGAKNM